MTALSQEIERLFRESGTILDDKLIPECVSICQTYSLQADDLLWKIQAIKYQDTQTRSEIVPVTMDTLKALKGRLHQQQIKGTGSKAQVKKNPAAAQVDRSKLPSFGRPQGVAATSRPAVQIKEEGEVEAVLIDPVGRPSVSFVGPKDDAESKRKRAYRYMYEKISERSEALDQIIEDFADLIRGHYNINELGDPSVTTEEEVVIVGRITHEAETSSTVKLIEGSMVIESSRLLSTGNRVPLVLDPSIKIRGSIRGVGGVGFYPGEIMAFKGRNGGGGYFLATEILAMPPLKPSPSALGLENPKPDPGSSDPASMVFASGPYTSDADLTYRPWKNLLQVLKVKKPDVLLLVGPFIDVAHPKIKNGDIDILPANLFKAQFANPIKGLLTASPGTIVLVVPSVRDLLSDHAAFPQPEMHSKLFDNHPRVHLLPNPSRFTINGVSFAASSVDALFHLRKEEYFKRGVEVEPLPATPDDLPNDAMANLCRHLLLQRSFYPLFPAPEDLSHEVNLDVTHSDGVRMVDDGDLDYAPDVLLLPSRLKQFSKLIHTTHVINPAFVSKSTYATLQLQPSSVGAPKERLQIEIAKIEAPPSIPT